MSADEPDFGGCFSFLVFVTTVAYLAISGWPMWFVAQDNVQSACPKSGVANVVTRAGWKGLRGFTITCLDGTVVRLDYKGHHE